MASSWMQNPTDEDKLMPKHQDYTDPPDTLSARSFWQPSLRLSSVACETQKPSFWVRYVDDTFAIIKNGRQAAFKAWTQYLRI